MKREFLITGDGSITIHLPEWNEQYHSRHGAIAEAEHVFIASGLHHVLSQKTSEEYSILEIGFGTGLNAYLTLLESFKLNISIRYTGVEAFPVLPTEISTLNYAELTKSSEELFLKLHSLPWNEWQSVTDHFQLRKQQKQFSEITDINSYDLVYFDAFGPRVQPELWTLEIFGAMFKAMKHGGVLVTYSAKGSVRRAMEEVGFTVERLPGPPGKREMLRATKTS